MELGPENHTIYGFRSPNSTMALDCELETKPFAVGFGHASAQAVPLLRPWACSDTPSASVDSVQHTSLSHLQLLFQRFAFHLAHLELL